MKLLITTGGTGGHIYPALALAEIYAKEVGNNTTVFIGSDDRMEASIIPDLGYPYYGLPVVGFHKGIANKLEILWKMSVAYKRARSILKKEKPDVVVGFGGYVSAPVILAAVHLKIPTLLHEQNSVVGKTNLYLEKKVSGVVTCYKEAKKQLTNKDVRLLGNPRATLALSQVTSKDYAISVGLKEDRKNVLIVMGSLGSATMNEYLKNILPTIHDERIHMLWVCGKDSYKEMKQYESTNLSVLPYVDQLQLLPFIDVMVCRAGATTAAEICALGVKSVLVPSPYVAHNHQLINAQALKREGAALMIEEKDFSKEQLEEALHQLLFDDKVGASVEEHAKELGHGNAAYDILAWCKEIQR